MAFLNTQGLERLWSHINLKLNNKVEKVSGKQLSTNDFTNEEKAKLASLKNAAQSDWNINNPQNEAYIKNRTHWEEADGIVHQLDEKFIPVISEEKVNEICSEYMVARGVEF